MSFDVLDDQVLPIPYHDSTENTGGNEMMFLNRLV